MRTNHFFATRPLTGITLLFLGAGLRAAPLTWFAGPSLDVPLSGAATTFANAFGNVLLGGDAGYSAESLMATDDYWRGFALLQNLAIAPGAVTNSDMVMVFGGSDGTNSTTAVVGYSLTGDGVPALAPLRVARSYLGYAPDRNGNPYAIGGLDENGQPLSSVERFNPDTGTAGAWSFTASLPTPRFNFPAVLDRTNQIYVFGGYTDTMSGLETGSVLRYSVSKNTWTNMPALPVAVAGSAAALGADGKIYVVGGISAGVTTNLIQVYNPTANSWTLSAPLPEALSACALGSDSLGRLIVMGGRDSDGNDVSDVWRSQQLNVPDTAPQFAQYPSLSATYAVPYTSSITATGNPQPTYLLLSGPDGMSVGADNGAINWTPTAAQIGSNAVSIRATNYAGYADWNFNLTISNPPPALVSNLTVVGVTEHSVTLSWDPEPLVVGATTYRVYLRHVLHDPRGSGGTVWYTQIGSDTTVPAITISGLAPGLTQGYYVAASAPGGTLGYAGISATTLSPQPPTNPRITGLTSTSISLAWDPSPGPVPIVSYEIWGWVDFGYSAVSSSFGAGISNTSFTVTGLALGSGHNWAVRAYDAEGATSSFVFFNNGYRVLNPVPVPASFGSATKTADGGFQFTASEGGYILQTVLIQATTNPADPASWVQIGSLLPTANPFSFTDTNAANYPARFYRILAP